MSFLMILALGAVSVVLLLGLFNMMRGGSPSRSQNLMRWRVILQFIAIIVLLGALWFSQRG
jgi:heme/copper-type cytochrome/quinol oxidase subunit 4